MRILRSKTSTTKFIKHLTENVVEVLIETINDSCNKQKKIYINTEDTEVIDNLFEFVEDCIENYYSIPFNVPRSFSSSLFCVLLTWIKYVKNWIC
jgi:HKD family nuclease